MSGRRPQPWIAAGITGVVIACIVVRAYLAPRGWLPTTDWALIELRVRDVGSAFPLLGAPSAARFHHPGPLPYLLLAPLYRALGSSPDALASAAALLSAATVAAIGATAWRRGGLALVATTMAVVLWLLGSLPAGFTRDPWNPWMAVLPFFLFVLLVWSVLDGDRWMVPAAAFVGSFVLQAHVGYLLLIGAGFLAMGADVVTRALRERRADAGDGEPAVPMATSRSAWAVLAAVAVLAVVWLPAIIEQFVGEPGNLSAMWTAFGAGNQGDRLSGTETVGVLASEMGGWAPWLSGSEPVDGIANKVLPGPPAAILVPVVMLGLGLWLSWHDSSARRFVLVMITADLVGVLSVSRVESERVLPYVVRFLWPLAACTTLAVLWAAVRRFDPAPATVAAPTVASAPTTPVLDGRRSWARSNAVLVVALALILAGSVRFAVRDDVTLPVFQTQANLDQAACLSQMLPTLLGADRSATVHLTADEGDWPIFTGPVANELERAGFAIALSPSLSFFVERPGREATGEDRTWVIARADNVEVWRGRADARELTSCDRLSADERRELEEARAGTRTLLPLRGLDLSLRDERAAVFELP